MRSLRGRLILGFALVAIVPLAVTMVILSRRIQETVRSEAGERLGAALGILRRQLLDDGARMSGKLEILARDPTLKRLYLVGHERDELSDYLAEKQFLLGLDVLQIVDTSGAVIADAATAPSALRSRAEEPRPIAMSGQARSGEPVRVRSATNLVLAPLDDGSGLVLAGRSAVLYQNEPVATVWGGTILDEHFLQRMKDRTGVDLALRDAAGRTIAATLKEDSSAASFLRQSIPLAPGPGPHATIVGLASTAAADRTVAELRATSLVLGAVAVAIAVLLGAVWSLQVSRPVERLADFSQRIAQGEWDEPLKIQSVRELQTLVEALDRMRTDLRTYRERLVASERQAAWSLMARKVAHEIRNPLTPIAVSVEDLKRSYDQKRPDFPEILDQAVKTIGEEVEALKRLLHEFSRFGSFPPAQLAPFSVADLITDLRTLYGRDVAEGRLAFTSPAAPVTITADRGQLRQALVNLIKNGLEAVDGRGRVAVAAHAADAQLTIEVSDEGPGLTPEQKAQLFVPNFTTKTHGSGLGLTIVERIVNEHRGTIAVDSEPGRGTTFRIRVPVA